MVLHYLLGKNSALARAKPTPKSIKHSFKLLFGHGIVISNEMPSFESIHESYRGFTSHYQSAIFPQVQSFEKQRIDKLIEFRKRLFIGIAAGIGIPVLTVILFLVLKDTFGGSNGVSSIVKNVGDLIIFAVLGALTFIAYWVSKPILEYKTNVKNDIFPPVFSYFEQLGKGIFSYAATSPLSIDALQPSAMIPSFDRCHMEDHVKGDYKEVALEMVEARLTETQGSGKNRRTVIKFSGMFVRMSMNKNFTNRTVVKRDHGKIGNWFAGKFGNKNMEKVALEDPVFEKEFEVYSTDQVEARYLLSTSFMERLLQLSNVVKSSGIQASFYENHLLLMIPSKHDHFEVGSIFTPATFEEEICNIFNEMEQFFSIIDTLKLNEQTRL